MFFNEMKIEMNAFSVSIQRQYRKLIFHENSLAHNIRICCPILLNFVTGNGSDTAVQDAKFGNDWVTEK